MENGRILAIESKHLLHSLRASDFDIPSAIGELVDNSIQADAKKIHIEIEDYSAGKHRSYRLINKMFCGDDGHGMKGDYNSILHSCIKLGYSTRFDERDGIGRFGVGMTLAGIRFATKIEVYSKQKDGMWNYVVFDLKNDDDLIKGIAAPIEKKLPDAYSSFVGKDQGTLVIWSEFDKYAEQDLHSSTYEDKFDASISLDPYGELNHWLGRTYRNFISNGTVISLNGRDVCGFDPLYLNKEKNQFPEDTPATMVYEDEIEWLISKNLRTNPEIEEYSKIKIRISLLPEEYRETESRGGIDFKGRYISENEGISIMRSNREVLYDAIPRFGPSNSKKITWEQPDRWWGCEISFDPILDEYFTVKNIKRGALPVKELKTTLYEIIRPIRTQCSTDVRDFWAKNKIKKETEENKGDNGLPTVHDIVENIAKKTKIVDKPKAGENLSEEEEENRMEGLTRELDELDVAKWKAKFKAQPFSIKDGYWKGDTFIEMTYLEGKAVLEYNLNHIFFKELNQIENDLKLVESPNSIECAIKVKTLLDVLLMSFVRSRQGFPEDEEFSVKQILDYVVRDWGRHLETYTKVYKEEISGDD